MVRLTKGDLLQADVEVLVNTVNCVGYMGKGIALQFRQTFPENFRLYKKACQRGEISPGNLFIFETGFLHHPRYIINFPTKRHWRDRSRMDDIQLGLVSLIREVKRLGIRSIAIPPLGCGLGGLDWQDVKPLIMQACAELKEVDVLLFESQEVISLIAIKTPLPKMTRSRAIFIKLIESYKELSYPLTLLEIQKLAYFLQEAGEPLKLRYERGHYGPYAHNLNRVLESLEGNYINGFTVNNLKPDAEIELLEGSIRVANEFLMGDETSKNLLSKVDGLIHGFETPYGLELLATIHWLGRHSGTKSIDEQSVVEHVHNWNPGKKQRFSAEHIQLAWRHLIDSGWL